MATKKQTTKKETPEKKDDSAKIVGIVFCTIIAVILLMALAMNIVVYRDDCASPCRGSDPYTACPDVCVVEEETLWEFLTGRGPHSVGY